eukprot:3608017-Prymnesium_polylepis.1
MAGTIAALPDRKGLTKALAYECINLAAVGSTNVCMHFRKRVLAHTRTGLALLQVADPRLRPLARRQRYHHHHYRILPGALYQAGSGDHSSLRSRPLMKLSRRRFPCGSDSSSAIS